MQTQYKLELVRSWPPSNILCRVFTKQTDQIDICVIYYCNYYSSQDKITTFQPFSPEIKLFS